MPKIEISRSIEIDSPVELVFASISNFREWPKWSPWLVTEPDCEVVYGDDGKSYAWNGQYVGSGEMAVVHETTNKSKEFALQFLKPWKSTAKVSMKLEPVNDSTRLTWSMDSSLPLFMFFAKRMMEGLIGMDYERGLVMLKDLLEGGEVPLKLEFGEATVGPLKLIVRKAECSIDEMPDSMKSDIEIIGAWLKEGEVTPSGALMSVYHKWDPAQRRMSYSVGFPVTDFPSKMPDGMVTLKIPETNTFTSRLTGPYRYLGNAWSAGMMRSRGGLFKQSRKIHPFEIYDNDPKEVDEKDLITTVHFPKR